MTSPHTIAYCEQCEVYMIKCGTCGNNSCNGGYGSSTVESYRQCPDCPDAYKTAVELRKRLNKIKAFQ